jgi:hypothetical protein
VEHRVSRTDNKLLLSVTATSGVGRLADLSMVCRQVENYGCFPDHGAPGPSFPSKRALSIKNADPSVRKGLRMEVHIGGSCCSGGPRFVPSQ